MMTNKDITYRFNLLFRISGLTKKEFAKQLNISASSLHAFLNGEYNTQKISMNIIQIGFSIDWLYTGKGKPMLADRENFEEYEIEYDRIYTDLLNWIKNKYGSILHFEVERGINIGLLKNTIEYQKFMPYSLIVKLRNAGYNWNPDLYFIPKK